MAITVKNISALAGGDISHVWWGLKGNGFVQGTNGAIAAGGDSGMGRFPATSTITPAVPELPKVDIDSDAGIDGAVRGQPNASSSAVVTGGVIDQVYMAAQDNRLVKVEGPDDLIIATQLCLAFNQSMYVINVPAICRDAGANYGELGYMVTEFWACTAEYNPFSDMGRGVQSASIINLILGNVGVTPWGETIVAAGEYGVTRGMGLTPYWSQYPVTYHTFVGDGATVVFTLDVTPAAEDGDALQMWEAGVSQSYTSDYSVVAATRVVTFVAAPASLAVAVAKVKYLPTC